jgi:hypothetical protein
VPDTDVANVDPVPLLGLDDITSLDFGDVVGTDQLKVGIAGKVPAKESRSGDLPPPEIGMTWRLPRMLRPNSIGEETWTTR